ncbi:MAG: hypothetical protein ACYSWX_05505, partial [Planctomycetota bacterium]
PNDPPAPIAAGFYAAQSDGFLSELTDSVLFNNDNLSDDPFGVSYLQDAANNNVIAASLPIKGITRAATVIVGGTKQQQQVISLDPRAAGDALVTVGAAPVDSFFDTVSYRGAFGPVDNWLAGWSASSNFGFIAPNGSVTEVTSANNAGTLTGNGEAPYLGNGNFGLIVTDDSSCGTILAPFGYSISLTANGLLPFGIPIPGTGCNAPAGDLLINPTTFQSFTVPTAGGPTIVPIPLPTDPVLAGLAVQAQGFYVTTAFAARVTQAVNITLGFEE